MKISGNVIQFKSENEFYQKEKSGLKSNTARFMTTLDDIKAMEFFKVQFSVTNDATIIIINKDNDEQFVRKITDISQYPGTWLYMISWSSAVVD